MAFSAAARLRGLDTPKLPAQTAFGALMAYATDPATVDYQPMHVNFGIMEPLPQHIRNKRERYAAYAERGQAALARYREELAACGLLSCAGDGASQGAGDARDDA